jgi:uncharacterized membrane protein
MSATKTRQHVAAAVKFNPKAIARDVKSVEGFNAKIAVLITSGVGSMACAYTFALLALISLPAAVQLGSVVVIVAWISQTFLQLVLLSIIMVGQRVQATASDARATKQFDDTEIIVDRLDETTAGGIKTVLDEVADLRKKLDAPAPKRK